MKNTKYLFFGGSYSNLQAIERLKEIADQENIHPENIFHTGDVVGYCAFPEQTINFVRNWGINVVAGNVEVQLAEGADDCGCNFEEGSRCANFSTLWYPYAKTKVSSENIDWMKGLSTHKKSVLNGKRFAFIHGGVEDISEFIFESTPWKKKQEIIDELDVDVVVAGHCGIPFIQNNDGKTWVNPGVIGMPANDGTQRVWFGIYDPLLEEMEIRSFEYDAETASEAMVINQLPEEYSKTLITGLWDNCEILPAEEKAQQNSPLEEKRVLI